MKKMYAVVDIETRHNFDVNVSCNRKVSRLVP